MTLRSRSRACLGTAAALLFALALGACTTVEHRSIQAEFNEAVQADNDWTVAPFAGGDPQELYRALCERLTPAYIESLDPKLRQNAWMLRAVASWRSGELADARAAAKSGVEASIGGDDRGSRDQLILAMIPALVIDSELRSKRAAGLDANGKLREPATYEAEFETAFRTAFDALRAAEANVKPETPASAVYYFHYQRWRLIQNWRSAITALPTGTTLQANAFLRCAEFLSPGASQRGEDTKAIAAAVRDQIPEGHPLRQLIASQEKSR